MEIAPPIERRLAAILAADIAGYSALMGADEETTVSDLKGHQGVVLPMISNFGGRVVDTAGDGILAEFPSVLNAVRCAVEIQQTMVERNTGVAPERQMLFRIGINLGDVVFDQNRIFGDGVNVAARLEALAPSGGICVSRAVREAVGNKLSVGFADLGEKQVKNIAKPVHVYEVSLHGEQVVATAALTPARLPSWLTLSTIAVGVAGALVIAAVAGSLFFRSTSRTMLPTPAASTSAVSTSSTTARGPDFAALPELPAPSLAVPTVGDFDGVWIATFTGGTHCALKSGSYQLTVRQSAILESRPEPGRVDATGAFRYTLLDGANANLIVEHRGKLGVSDGDGSYQVLGGGCEGKTEFTRAPRVPPVAGTPSANTSTEQATAKPEGPQNFNGVWQITLTGGVHCPVKSNTWQIVVVDGVITPSRPESGAVEADGTFRFTTPARVNPNTVVRYRGKFAGDRGNGDYTGGGGCIGTIELKRIAVGQR